MVRMMIEASLSLIHLSRSKSSSLTSRRSWDKMDDEIIEVSDGCVPGF